MTKEEIESFKNLIQTISKAKLDVTVADCVRITRTLEACSKILAKYQDAPKQVEQRSRTIKK